MTTSMRLEELIAYGLGERGARPQIVLRWPSQLDQVTAAIDRLSRASNGGVLGLTLDDASGVPLARRWLEDFEESGLVADIVEGQDLEPPALILLIRSRSKLGILPGLARGNGHLVDEREGHRSLSRPEGGRSRSGSRPEGGRSRSGSPAPAVRREEHSIGRGKDASGGVGRQFEEEQKRVTRLQRTPRRGKDQEPVKEATLDDLDLVAVGEATLHPKSTFTGEIIHQVANEMAIEELGIATVSDEGLLVPTVAGMVVFGLEPERFLPGMGIVATIYGQRETLRGSLRGIVDQLLFKERLVGILGRKVLIEVVLNAFLHREWSGIYRRVPVVLELGPGRLKLSNPGRLEGPIEAGASNLTNVTLVNLASRVGAARIDGYGLTRLEARVRRMAQKGARREPVQRYRLEARDGWIHLQVEWPPSTEELERVRCAVEVVKGAEEEEAVAEEGKGRPTLVEKRAEESRPVDGPRSPERDSTENGTAVKRAYRSKVEREEELLKRLHEQGPQTARELNEGLGWSQATTRNVIAGLLEAGKIHNLAKCARSPKQLYVAVG